MLRPKMEVIRELIFSYLEAKSLPEIENLREICEEKSALEVCMDILGEEDCEHF